MSKQPELLSLFADEPTLRVFETIAKRRRLVFKDLCEYLILDSDRISSSLQVLMEAGLIKSVDAPAGIEDFKHYYISAEGLRAERLLRQIRRF